MKLSAWGLGPSNSSPAGRPLLSLVLAICCGCVTGCDKVSSAVSPLGVQPVQARTAENGIESFATYKEALIGKDSETVAAVFGKPKGVFERRTGKVWMYSRWCVEFNSKGQVARIERDIAASGSGRRPSDSSTKLAARPVVASQPAPPSSAVKRISNGGQPVDLDSLMPAGKIIVVDFYADWCGPCQRISPHLEKLASENPEIVLLKVDIVSWGTPVAKQHDISSIPNIRVFNRNKDQIGEPTSNLSIVQSYIRQAGG